MFRSTRLALAAAATIASLVVAVAGTARAAPAVHDAAAQGVSAALAVKKSADCAAAVRFHRALWAKTARSKTCFPKAKGTLSWVPFDDQHGVLQAHGTLKLTLEPEVDLWSIVPSPGKANAGESVAEGCGHESALRCNKDVEEVIDDGKQVRSLRIDFASAVANAGGPGAVGESTYTFAASPVTVAGCQFGVQVSASGDLDYATLYPVWGGKKSPHDWRKDPRFSAQTSIDAPTWVCDHQEPNNIALPLVHNTECVQNTGASPAANEGLWAPTLRVDPTPINKNRTVSFTFTCDYRPSAGTSHVSVKGTVDYEQPACVRHDGAHKGETWDELKAEFRHRLHDFYQRISDAGGCYIFTSGFRSPEKQKKLYDDWHAIADRQGPNDHRTQEQVNDALRAHHFRQLWDGVWVTDPATGRQVARNGPAKKKSRHSSRRGADVTVYWMPFGPEPVQAQTLARYLRPRVYAIARQAGLCGPPAQDDVHVELPEQDKHGNDKPCRGFTRDQ